MVKASTKPKGSIAKKTRKAASAPIEKESVIGSPTEVIRADDAPADLKDNQVTVGKANKIRAEDAVSKAPKGAARQERPPLAHSL